MDSNEQAIEAVLEAIIQAGYTPGVDVYLGLDVASSEFFRDGRYCLEGDEQTYTSEEFSQVIMDWIDRYPILTIEDAMAEDDWNGWKMLTEELGPTTQIVGDDIFATNPERIKKGIDHKVGNSVLVKINQIGTISEALVALNLSVKNGYKPIISHRSGETEDTFISDLSVAVSSGQIKTGSLCRTDRIAKYNQLLRIEEELGISAKFADMSVLGRS